ncbi:porin [Pasteurella bettyae]|uniref:Gram-negative porin n=1 Tax=Pasteurella bettyae CCUG 2042 TaxID=1095749 RepID=I3DAN5_9PAST|nr:porin [Pasteurella bettyae]EIJ68778.1 gram-negative porin [Pasteurella bettyae CCUG 2042]SUB20881.1 OmpH porin-like protein [Pasteurella bettyae]
MKKTLVALAVAATTIAATAPASAFTVYEQDGAKVELSGSFRAFLGRVGDDNRGDLKNDGSRIVIKASQDLGNGLSGFAGYQIRFEDKTNTKTNKEASSASSFGSPTTRELYAGLAHKDIGALSFGRQATSADGMVLTDQYYYRSGEFNPLTTRADKSIKFKSADWNGFGFSVDYLFGNEYKDNASADYKHGYAAGLTYTYDISDVTALNFAAGYSYDAKDKATGSATGAEKDAWVVSTELAHGPFSLSAAYGQTTDEGYEYADADGRYISVGAHYQVIEPSKIYLQWERLSVKDNNTGDKDISNRYLAGVDYKFHKNVVTYVQYEHVTDKTEGERTKDNVFGVGLRVYF